MRILFIFFYFFFEAPFTSIPMQKRSSRYFPWFPVLQWELVGVPNYTSPGLTGGIPGIHGEISVVASFGSRDIHCRVKSSLSVGIPEKTLGLSRIVGRKLIQRKTLLFCRQVEIIMSSIALSFMHFTSHMHHSLSNSYMHHKVSSLLYSG